MKTKRYLSNIFYVLIVLSFHSFVFSAKYFTVTDNQLELDRSYSWVPADVFTIFNGINIK